MNSHQRRELRRFLKRIGVHAPQQMELPLREGTHEGWKAFFQHPILLAAVFAAAGIVGAYVYTPSLVICGVCVVIAFYESRVVARRSTFVRYLSYVVVLVISLAIVLELAFILRSRTPQFYTPSDIAKEIKNVLREDHGVTNVRPVFVSPPVVPVPKRHANLAVVGTPESPYLKEPFPVGQQFAMNFTFKNAGEAPAQIVFMCRRIYLQTSASDSAEKRTINAFMAETKSIRPMKVPTTLNIGESQFFTAPGPTIAGDDVDALREGRKVLYLVSEIRYEDEAGKHIFRKCMWLQPPAGLDPAIKPIWHFCDAFNRSQ